MNSQSIKSQSVDDQLRKAVASKKWFHSIDFGNNLISAGRFTSGSAQNYTIFPILRLLDSFSVSQCSCLDVGTMDGIISFTLKKMGASRVVATDLEPRETFTAGRDYLDLDIQYLPSTSLNELPTALGEESFDLIVCAGVLYHLIDPLGNLLHLRNLVRTDGYLLLETQYLHNEKDALISFSPSDLVRGNVHANTFFRPSFSALYGMIEVAGFDVVCTISINGRITFCAKAKKL